MSKIKKQIVPKDQKINGSFKLIPVKTLISEEFQSLDPVELKIYVCFITYWMRKSKYGNTVKMSVQFIADHTHLGRTTIWRKLKTLRAKQFIDYVGVRNELTTYTLNPKYTTDIST